MIFVSGILTAISVYLVLSKKFDTNYYGDYFTNTRSKFILITMGGLKHGTVPIYEKEHPAMLILYLKH